MQDQTRRVEIKKEQLLFGNCSFLQKRYLLDQKFFFVFLVNPFWGLSAPRPCFTS